MIVALAERVIEIGGDAFSRYGNHLRQAGDTRRRSLWRVEKGVKRKAPGHHAKRRLLTTLPVRPLLRRIVDAPVFRRAPERLNVICITRAPVGASERVGEGEAR